MNLTKKIFIPLASAMSIGATIACPIALVSCNNNNHITIDKAAKTQTIDGFLAYYPMTLNKPWAEDEYIKVELVSEPDPNWQFSLEIEPMNAANIQMRLTLGQGVHGETHNFDAKFTVFKKNSNGATVWEQTITDFKVIYN